ncbi:MAG: helix-turn-helix domain-containing protein [Clostridia bacterium]|nr:helix-turn-helix domain-containing protein [Clostridia bacterium]MBQ5904354.1 helix-turn-helix domain-containing protein [Clostridia bacterium]
MQIFDPRQSMSDSKFEIFHYRDAKFEGVPVHQHDFYEVYYFIGGSVEYSVEGRTYELKSGDLLLINPLELHQPRIAPDQQDYERIVLWINKNYLSELCFNKTSLTRCFDSSQPDHTNLLRPTKIQQSYISAMLDELITENTSDGYAVEIASEAILLRFLVELNRLTIDSSSALRKDEASSSIIPDVLEYINKHFCEKLTLNEIADEFFVSKYYLSHAFNNVVGTSVHRYIVLKRLIHAKQMLLSGIKSTTAATNCGFNDYAGFYRAFTAEYGVTPTEFVRINK